MLILGPAPIRRGRPTRLALLSSCSRPRWA